MVIKKKDFPSSKGYNRRLVLIKKKGIENVPLSKILKKHKLSRKFHFDSSSKYAKGEVMLERFVKVKPKKKTRKRGRK